MRHSWINSAALVLPCLRFRIPTMLKRTAPPALLLLIFLAAPPAIAQERTYESTDGGRSFREAPSTRPIERAADPTLNRAAELLAHNQNKAARQTLVDWEKSNRHALLRDRALYLLAEAYYRLGDRILAFYQCDELLDTYPDSALYLDTLSLQYKIADDYLAGRKIRVWGIFYVGAEEEAIEMLFRIQQRSPGSPLAEKSLLRTADYYFESRQFDLAADAYAAYIRSYGRSPEIPRVRLRQAFAAYAQFEGTKFDPTPLIDARAQLADIVAAYPDLAREQNLLSFIERIDAALARKLWERGDFYRRTRQPRAAAYMWQFLLKTYPESDDARRAREDLAKLPPGALQGPQPTTGAGYLPASRPADDNR